VLVHACYLVFGELRQKEFEFKGSLGHLSEKTKGWECRSEVDCLPSTHKALDLIAVPQNKTCLKKKTPHLTESSEAH
jgi:hypothetical protein